MLSHGLLHLGNKISNIFFIAVFSFLNLFNCCHPGAFYEPVANCSFLSVLILPCCKIFFSQHFVYQHSGLVINSTGRGVVFSFRGKQCQHEMNANKLHFALKISLEVQLYKKVLQSKLVSILYIKKINYFLCLFFIVNI